MALLERLGGREAMIEGIVGEFRELSRYPHPSWHEAESAAALEARLRGWGLRPARDAFDNLCCDVPAAPGYEGAPLLILQGHLDMVCAVGPGSGFDPLADPVGIRAADGLLRSDGRSSLGADNSLGNAAVLWLLGRGLAHGPLRLLFTTAEEVGLQGAARVDPAWLAGARYLLNTDGFKLGRLVVSSAGGRRETYARPLETAPPLGGRACRLALTGGTGGHSGEDIHRRRANALRLLAGLLTALGQSVGYELACFSGGTAHNAIPACAEAVVVLPDGGQDALDALSGCFRADWLARFGATDPGLTLSCAPAPVPARVWTGDCRDAVLSLTGDLFTGVYAPHRRMPEVTGASANLGRIWTEGGNIEVCAFLRCAEQADTDALAAQHDAAARAAGFAGTFNAYPGWPGDAENPLARTMAEVFRRETGREAEITAVHVGLEPSVLRAKNPALTMVSAGPDILDAHSVDERASLAALPEYALLLAGTLEAVGREGL